MYLTVEQALSVYPLTEARLVAGKAGRNRIVKSVNVMDAPDIANWIKEGEMLFTTAYLIKDHPEEAADLIVKLNRRGSSGLGIKLGRFWTSIPDRLIAQADELGFPLIELPYPFTFSDQINGLFHAEMKRNTSVLQDVLDKQIRLMRFALQTNPVRQLFDAVAEVIGEPVAVVGSRGRIVYNTSAVPDAELVREWPWPLRPMRVKSEGWQAFCVPLLKNDRCTGYVLFFTPRQVLSAVEESLYIQASELLSFHLNFNGEPDFEVSSRNHFSQLIKRHLQDGLPAEMLAEYAERREIGTFKRPYRCVLTDVAGPADEAARIETLEWLKEEYVHHPRLQEMEGLHVLMGEGLLSLFPVSDGESDGALAAALEDCLSDLKKVAPKAAVSCRKIGPQQLAEAFGECRETLRLSGEWGSAGRVMRCETLDLAFLFEHVPKEKMRMYCDRMLGGLMGKDPEYAQEMLRTLEAYLDNDGQLNETAKKLFIHRNTATYRIEKLSELLDVDFKKINDLLRLKMAFLFRRMLSAEDGRTVRAR
ncbi:PucR family transcriptional regulator [Cohnella laeviribosi]|uniref:PucR family transcriptional regulator n=1 Tax=Cohnella laeviribosi TaxID=380174 RepID=UPI003D199EE9